MNERIDIQELRQLMTSGEPFALFDVRERGRYAQKQIPGAVPVPRGQLEFKITSLVPDRQVPIVCYCDDGARSARATTTLRELGYGRATALDGGLPAWESAGYETQSGVNVIGKEYGEKVSVQSGLVQLKPEQLAAIRASGRRLLVLDARTRQEYQHAHLPGAFNVPGGELPATVLRLLRQPEHQDATFVVNCAGRTRSILGADILRRLGLAHVYALENGTMAWSMAGFPLERGPGEALAIEAPADSVEHAATLFADRLLDGTSVRRLSAEELLELRSAGVLHYLLDVRLPEEYLAGHLPGALSCPGGQIANAADELIAVRQALIVCLSNQSTRAKIAAWLCAQIGYPNVAYLESGLTDWVARGLAIEVGERPLDVPGLVEAKARAKGIDPGRLQILLDGNPRPQIVDVRRSSEYALGHIAGSRWIPRGDLERWIERYLPDRQTTIVVVSDHGQRSALAASTLADLGYQAVVYLEGGLTAWRATGQALEEGLTGADVTLDEAKQDVDLVRRAGVLERSRGDMEAYLAWEVQLGKRHDRS